MVDFAVIGVDCGSTVCKAVLMRAGAVVFARDAPTGWDPGAVSAGLVRDLLAGAGLLRAQAALAATGYGRGRVEGADARVTEITCHARGAEFLRPGVRLVIDIGGQDSKVIAVRDGKACAFQMNDRCAAGTGRFLEMTALRLGLSIDELAGLAAAGESCTINSMCAVFADSELVSLLASGVSRGAIAGGVIASIASRTAAIAARVGALGPALLTGGLSSLAPLRLALGERLNVPVEWASLSRFAGAIGAALCGAPPQSG
ncbi:MAG: acyl-CoA dehydratase activase [Spirochaetaceae bacterium]|jgi:predicted CoA-substrate-specific enzyme activase|nr:acyl-CoA dehydratase activase [Spirochaetaceae bacterium]